MTIRPRQAEFDSWSYQAATVPPPPLHTRWTLLRLVAVALIAAVWPRMRRWD